MPPPNYKTLSSPGSSNAAGPLADGDSGPCGGGLLGLTTEKPFSSGATGVDLSMPRLHSLNSFQLTDRFDASEDDAATFGGGSAVTAEPGSGAV